MRKVKLVTIMLIMIIGLNELNAQKLNLKWSDQQVYDGKKDGFFDSFIGANSKYVYVKVATRMRARRNAAKATAKSMLSISCLDKTTMKKVSTAVLHDPKNPADKSNHAGFAYYKTIVFENSVYVFWKKEINKKEELYVQTFDAKLKKQQNVKKIYDVTMQVEKRAKPAEMFVIANDKVGEKILIGCELSAPKEQSLKVEYKVLKADLSFEASKQVTLPIKVLTNTGSLSSSYLYGDDGNLHIKTNVRDEVEEGDSGDKKGSRNNRRKRYDTYPVMTIVTLESGEIKSIPLKFENKNIFNFDYHSDKTNTRYYGYFCDKTKDAGGYTTHGIFYCLVDNETKTITKSNFAYFEKSFLDELFKEDKKDQVTNTRKKKRSKGPDENSIRHDYTIEHTEILDNNEIALFCSIMNNYSVTTCDSKGNCTTRYYCEKKNVTAFKLDGDGNIKWASNINRKKVYNGWYIYDVSVIKDKDLFYVIYGSSYQTDAKEEGRKTKKSKKQVFDSFEYATINANLGKFNKDEYKVNPLNTPKENKKSVVAKDVVVLDNQFFVNYTKYKNKVGPTVLTCAGSLLCPYLIINLWNPKIKKGNSFYGTIVPLNK